MNITNETNVAVIAVNSRKGSDNKTTYYSLAIMQDGQVANISCTEEVADIINADFSPLKPFRLITVYSETYKTFRATGVCVALPEETKPTETGTAKPEESAKADSRTDTKPETAKPTK